MALFCRERRWVYLHLGLDLYSMESPLSNKHLMVTVSMNIVDHTHGHPPDSAESLPLSAPRPSVLLGRWPWRRFIYGAESSLHHPPLAMTEVLCPPQHKVILGC